MSGLEYLIENPIGQFPENRLPTISDVLRFYAQFWRMHGSDSTKENIVAEELIKLYRGKNITVFNVKTIKNQIHRIVANLKMILKFKSKNKTAANIQKETLFRSILDEVFEIHREVQTVDEPGDANVTNDIPMEVDNFDGIYLENLVFGIYTFNCNFLHFSYLMVAQLLLEAINLPIVSTNPENLLLIYC